LLNQSGERLWITDWKNSRAPKFAKPSGSKSPFGFAGEPSGTTNPYVDTEKTGRVNLVMEHRVFFFTWLWSVRKYVPFDEHLSLASGVYTLRNDVLEEIVVGVHMAKTQG
jgi:hypothetical protein